MFDCTSYEKLLELVKASISPPNKQVMNEVVSTSEKLAVLTHNVKKHGVNPVTMRNLLDIHLSNFYNAWAV